MLDLKKSDMGWGLQWDGICDGVISGMGWGLEWKDDGTGVWYSAMNLHWD